jgi:hypothetical protein
VDGEIDLAREQRLFDLLGEQALAADLGERPIDERIARSADYLDRDGLGFGECRMGFA